MPLTWTIDHATRTIVTTAVGPMSLQEVMEYLGRLPGEGGVGYRAIFDCRRAVGVNIRLGEIVEQSKLVGSRKSDGFDGAIAIIVGSLAEREMAEYYAEQLNKARLCRVFQTIEDARAWYVELDAAAGRAG